MNFSLTAAAGRRRYDELGRLRPAQVDPSTGYRGYAAEQLVSLAHPVSRPPADLPPPDRYLARRADERGYRFAGYDREPRVHEADDISRPGQQVFDHGAPAPASLPVDPPGRASPPPAGAKRPFS